MCDVVWGVFQSTFASQFERTIGIDPMDDPEELTRKRVGDYLLANSSFLEDHVLEHVDVETIVRWLIRRTRKERVTRSSTRSINSDLLLSPTPDRKVSLSRWKVHVYYHFLINLWN